jgi:hypothetical protein
MSTSADFDNFAVFKAAAWSKIQHEGFEETESLVGF